MENNYRCPRCGEYHGSSKWIKEYQQNSKAMYRCPSCGNAFLFSQLACDVTLDEPVMLEIDHEQLLDIIYDKMADEGWKVDRETITFSLNNGKLAVEMLAV